MTGVVPCRDVDNVGDSRNCWYVQVTVVAVMSVVSVQLLKGMCCVVWALRRCCLVASCLPLLQLWLLLLPIGALSVASTALWCLCLLLPLPRLLPCGVLAAAVFVVTCLPVWRLVGAVVSVCLCVSLSACACLRVPVSVRVCACAAVSMRKCNPHYYGNGRSARGSHCQQCLDNAFLPGHYRQWAWQ